MFGDIYEKDFSAQQYQKGQNAWFQGQNANKRRHKCFKAKKGERPETVDCKAFLIIRPAVLV